MAKKTTKQIVKENEAELLAMTTHTELRMWAMENGLDSASGFSNFKKGLIEIGVFYDQMKQEAFEASEQELDAKITHRLTLYTDAKASAGRFGICDKDGNVVWYGRFFENDNASEQSAAELVAARKAVWFASKVKEANQLEAMELVLIVDAQWLTYQDHGGQKGYVLTNDCRKHNIRLIVEWIPGTQNPADKWTTASGYQKWQENDLRKLITEIQN